MLDDHGIEQLNHGLLIFIGELLGNERLGQA